MSGCEGLEFCLNGRKESTDDLEHLLGGKIWRDKNNLPDPLVVTRWNGFGKMGRTTIFMFFVPEEDESIFKIIWVSRDIYPLGPLIEKWAAELKADSWGRFESIYADEPAILFASKHLVYYYSDHCFRSGFFKKTNEVDLPGIVVKSLFKSVIEFRETAQLTYNGTYSPKLSDEFCKIFQRLTSDP